MMIVTPINPNAVEIPTIQTGCMKTEFESIYPVRLNGIIGQDEFAESITNINQAISSRKSLCFCTLLAVLSLVGGIALFIAGGITAVTSRTYGFPVLVGVGFGVFVFGMLVLSIGCCLVQSRRAVRMQRAIANESMKYSTRSPTPCSWRLHSSRSWVGGYGNRQTVITYRLVIEIEGPGASGNGNVPYQLNNQFAQPMYFSSQQNNIGAPPPYSSNAAGRFCSQCGTRQQNPMAKFCSSCGQPL